MKFFLFVIPFIVIFTSQILCLGDAPGLREFSVHDVGTIGSTPFVQSWLTSIDKYRSKGIPEIPNPPDCSAEKLASLINSQKTVSSEGLITEAFFKRCEKIITRNAPGNFSVLLKSLDADYEIKNRNDIKEVVIRTPNSRGGSTKLRGLLALKPSQEKRPLVVVVCGTLCNVLDNIPVQALMSVFDSTPFNVLVLPSITGSDWVNDNQRLDIGGVEEGREIFGALRVILDPNTSQSLYSLTSSVHMLGISLGGQASLYTSLYASYNKLFSQGPQIQSVFAYCPVVNLQETLDHLDSQKGRFGDFYRGAIWSMLYKNPNLVGFPIAQPADNNYAGLIGKVLSKTYTDRFDALAPFESQKLSSAEAFWKLNGFSYFTNNVKIPTFVFGSEDDPVVFPTANSLKLKADLRQSPNEKIAVVTTQRGLHCASQIVYGLDIFSTLVESFILKHSPEFDRGNKRHSVSLAFNPLASGEKYFGSEWKLNRKTEEAVLKVKVYDPLKMLTVNARCDLLNPYYLPSTCFKDIIATFPLSQFLSGKPDLSNNAVQEMVIRWLNHRVKPVKSNDEEAVDTTEAPTKLVWYKD